MKVIRYMIEMAHSSESPEGEITTRSELHQRVLLCHGEADFEAKMVIAEAEAYNGEYTIEDDGQPEPEPTEQEQLRADVDFLLAMGGVL